MPPLALNHCTGTAGGKSGSIVTDTEKLFAGIVAFSTTNTVSCVEATWIQPSITCTASQFKSDVVIYVAMGGTDGKGTSKSHQHAIKVATEAYCDSAYPRYLGWTYVDVKGGSNNVPFTIAAHDKMWAQVRSSGGVYKLTLADLTARQTVTNTSTFRAFVRDDAQWDVQAVDGVPIAKFETFKFTGAEAVIAGNLRTVDRWPRDFTTMASGSLKRVTVSKFGTGTFTETWRHK